MCGHTVKCLKYDVQSQPVSIHLPLSRYLAGNLLLCFHIKDSIFPSLQSSFILIFWIFNYGINTAVSWFSTLAFFLGLHVYMGDYNLQFGCSELNVQVININLRMNYSQKILGMINKCLDKLGCSTSKYRVKLCTLFSSSLTRAWTRWRW